MSIENKEETLDLDAIWAETDDLGDVLSSGDPDLEDAPEDEGNDDPSEDEQDDDEDKDGAADDADETLDEAGEEGEEDDTDEPPVDYKALWEKSQHEVKTMVGRLKAAESRSPKEPPSAAPSTIAAPAAPSEDDTFLNEFGEKYHPEVIKAIDLITTKKAKALIDETLATRLNPLETATQDLLGETHFRTIEAVHPDLEEIDASPIFESWLENKPAFLRPVYENIRNNGTPAQVIEMLNENKNEVGINKPKPKTTPKPKVKDVIAATAVNRKRGTASTAKLPDANDLEAIWAETDD
jgi:hypothetical protein